MKTIHSRSNETIKHVAALEQKKYRALHHEFIAEGLRVCSTLIKHDTQLKQLFVIDAYIAAAQKLVTDEYITVVSEPVMQKLSTATTPSGIMGQFAIPSAPSAQKLSTGIVLAQISDPGNMGTLIRTAAALNYTSVVAIEGADPYSPKVVQASAGTIGMINLFQWDWHDVLEQKKSLKLIALIVSGGQSPEQLTMPDALLVVGSEAYGIPQPWIENCQAQLTLSMPGSSESLNAAVAGSIALYLWSTKT